MKKKNPTEIRVLSISISKWDSSYFVIFFTYQASISL